MAIGEFTKQIVQQGILSATSPKEAPAAPATAPQENISAVFLGQVAAMQKALKEDEELAVHYHSGPEVIRVREIFAPSRRVVVLTGTDAAGNFSRVIAAVDSLQLICKVVKAAGKAVRVNLVTPKQ